MIILVCDLEIIYKLIIGSNTHVKIYKNEVLDYIRDEAQKKYSGK
jgi:hypothetical protein